MNLISCDECGIVLDAIKLNFPEDIYLEDGSIDGSKGRWDGGEYVPFVACPVCKSEILKTGI